MEYKRLKRGDIWLADLTASCHADNKDIGTRPIIVISNQEACDRQKIVSCVTLTSKVDKLTPNIDSHMMILPSAINGLDKASLAKCEQIYALSRFQLVGKIGTLDPYLYKELDRCLSRALGLGEGGGDRNGK